MTDKTKKNKAKPVSVVVLLIAAALGYLASTSEDESGDTATTSPPPAANAPPAPIERQQASPASDGGARRIADAFRRQLSGIQVEVTGSVRAVLPDDNDGTRHQKFILELSDAHTLLVSHNIDLAPRVANLARGDQVEVRGQYEWSDQGGVLHWTHHDPAKRHAEGWIKHDGQVYR